MVRVQGKRYFIATELYCKLDSLSFLFLVIQCPTRLFRPAQIMTCTSLFMYGSVCHFSCSPGYVLDGEETNECMQQVDSATGTWSAEQPHCTGTIPKYSLLHSLPVTMFPLNTTLLVKCQQNNIKQKISFGN